MTEISKFLQWLYEKKQINLKDTYEEYLEENVIFLNDIFVFIEKELSLPQNSIKPLTPLEGKKRGSNMASFGRGLLVKYILKRKINKFNLSNIYLKLFGFSRDHTAAIHYRDAEFINQDLQVEKKLHEFLDDKNIIWTLKSES
jgi:hypothetical protein